MFVKYYSKLPFSSKVSQKCLEMYLQFSTYLQPYFNLTPNPSRESFRFQDGQFYTAMLDTKNVLLKPALL